MANKVSILITNSEGKHFELTNDKMAIFMSCQRPSVNWKVVFGKEISPYAVILCDYHNGMLPAHGLGYCLVENCGDKEDATNIIQECRTKLKEQYERMMMIRVAKKYELDARTLLKIELEYHDSDNYMVEIHPTN